MGSFVRHGGYVVTTPRGNYVSEREVSQETLRTIANYLGIERVDTDKLVADSIRTIFIYTPDTSQKE